jgi:ureidoglycolate lyase
VILRAEPLTAAAFAPFGQVLSADAAFAREINSGFTTRFHAMGRVQSDAGVILSLFRGRERPLTISMLERHPAGSQAFLPAGGGDWLVVVAPRPEAAALRAFRATSGQGVNYAAGTWHHPLLVLGGPQDFWVVDRAGPGGNLDEAAIDPAVTVQP